MDVRDFLASRVPSAPAALEAWLNALPLEGPCMQALSGGAAEELRKARSETGRVRRSAFHLLGADALITYACEAALDAPDPVVSLGVILREAADPER